MRLPNRHAILAAAVLPVVACSDDPVEFRRDARVALPPSLAVAATGGYADITRLRVTVLEPAGDTVLRVPAITVDPAAATFETTVVLPLDTAAALYIVAELLSTAAPQETVEFTVRIGPARVEPGRMNDLSDPPTLVLRGPLDNASVVDVALSGEPFIEVGADAVFHAAFEGGTTSSRALWRTSDTTVIRVTATTRDSARVNAVGPGSATLYAEAGTVGDSVTIVVGVAPPEQGETLTWVGGAVAAPNDWFTAANWAPARVPTLVDSIFVPSATPVPVLTQDAVIAALATEQPTGVARLDLGDATLTVRGDVSASVTASGGGLILDGEALLATGRLPRTLVRGGLTVGPPLTADGVTTFLEIAGDLTIDGGTSGGELDLGNGGYVGVEGNLLLQNATLRMGRHSSGRSSLTVLGDMTLDGGHGTGAITGGEMYLEGDFIVTDASCTAFAAAPEHVTMFFPQPDATIRIACPGPDGNRFGYVEWSGGQQTGVQRTITLESDLYANDIFPYYEIRLVGAGATRVVRTESGFLDTSTFDNVVIEAANDDPAVEPLFAQEGYPVVFVNIADASRPQISVAHPGLVDDVVYLNGITYDSLSAAPYLRIVDTDGAEPLLWAAAGHNHGDGPARTETAGGAYVIWEGLPWEIDIDSGNNQSASQFQALPNPLRVQLGGFWNDCRFCAGYTIEWTVESGGGSVTTTSTTDANGFAEATWTLGAAGSAQRVVARLPDLAPFGTDTVVFSAVSQP